MSDAEASEDSAKNRSGHFKSEDERSDEAEFENGIGSNREERAGSRVDVDALNGKQNGNYGEDVDTFKGDDYNNFESKFDISNVSSYIISRHELI